MRRDAARVRALEAALTDYRDECARITDRARLSDRAVGLVAAYAVARSRCVDKVYVIMRPTWKADAAGKA